MNKYEKSLERIKKYVEPQESWSEDDWEHYKTIIDALEKQIPKKPIYKAEGKYTTMVCPVCEKGNLVLPYCKHCGQALDWSELR